MVLPSMFNPLNDPAVDHHRAADLWVANHKLAVDDVVLDRDSVAVADADDILYAGSVGLLDLEVLQGDATGANVEAVSGSRNLDNRGTGAVAVQRYVSLVAR